VARPNDWARLVTRFAQMRAGTLLAGRDRSSADITGTTNVDTGTSVVAPMDRSAGRKPN